jgi:signal transduction histidine kinase/ActR/RegA family two-component response regulator
MTQADILGRTSAPALEFNDPATAKGNLELLKARPQIVAAAIYAPDGKLFSTYASRPEYRAGFPIAAQPTGYRIEGDEMTVFHRIVENGDLVGTVYLRAHYELYARLKTYAAILAATLIASLVVAAIFSFRLQAALTKPILAVAGVAREVMQSRDFSLRAEKTTEDEVGVLVDAFNGMLNEIDQRRQALEQEMKERSAAEEALRIADRRKDEFLATLAHELRNPLAPLSSGLEIMRVTGADSAPSRRARDAMERQLRQMVRLVDDLIDVSRISRGRLTIRKESVELQAVVRSALETVATLMEARKLALQVELPDAPVHIDADATRLSQVFSNLLNNAAKYTEPGGRISFAASVQGDEVVVRVSDTGIGIPQEMLGRIFDMFTQVDHSLERSQSGLGVGLTLARRLVELHGGTLEASSEGPGRGSAFVARLPIASAATPKSPDEYRNGDTAAPRYRILLADDNVDFARNLADLLRATGHTVRVTHDGDQALEAAAQFQPEFAFLDIGLPKMNGYDLARRLREQPSIKDCVLVAVTGWGQAKDRELAAQAGFDHHLVKPVKFEQIQRIVTSGRPVGPA